MVRFQIALTPDEASALARWAARERRDPRAQAALILARELEKMDTPATDRLKANITEEAASAQAS